jgi:hypothetical protein
VPVSTSTTSAGDAGLRSRASFGGLIPTEAVARGGSTIVAALCVELHSDGALLPLVVLTDNAGPIAIDTEHGVVVSDDAGHPYAVAERGQHSGLGLLQLDVWISPAPPPEARRLHVTVDGLTRTAITRRGDAVSRLLSHGPWELDIDLVPERTAVPTPDEPPAGDAPARPARVPVRAWGSFEGIVPIGQARLGADRCTCVWALERYRDRGVLSVSVLAPPEARDLSPGASAAGAVELWDDRGRRYEVAPVHSVMRPGWTEVTLETTPALGEDVAAIGLRIRPDGQAGAGDDGLLFGARVAPAAT